MPLIDETPDDRYPSVPTDRAELERLRAALRRILEMATDDLDSGNYCEPSNIHQIEATARAALKGGAK